MDIDDPIQQLLKNTGWSCDDLLEKIQKYKSQKECEKDSVESVKETEKKTFISTEVVNVATNNIQGTNESELHTHNCDENTVVKVKDKSTSSSINALEKEFSDTDDEEVDVNVTNSSIIDEIIDDIASVDNADELSDLIKNTKQALDEDNDEEQAEITEVTVIEVDEEEEDDYFEEECSYSIIKPDILTLNSKNIEYLETFPRKSSVKLIDLTGGDDDDTVKDKNISEGESIQEKRIISNVDDKISISEKNSEISNAININNSESDQDVLINTDDSKVDEANACLGNVNIDTKSSDEVREESIDKDITEIDRNMIYNKSCEKANCDKERTTLDKMENENMSYPISKRINDENVNDVEDSSTLTNLEDIRNNLKLQLNSLRTRKKGHFLQQLRSKIEDSSECNLNKLNNTHCKSKIITSESTNTGFNEATEDVKTSSVTFEEDNQQRDLYTQTNELGLVILSVQGGIELGEQMNETNQEGLNIMQEDSSNTINSALDNSTDSNTFVLQSSLGKTEKNETSGVFDEIRRIIRKQKLNNSTYDKRTVDVHKNISNSFSRSANNSRLCLNDESNEKPECSSASADNSQSSFTYDETSQNIDKNSPFVSNSLDEFLTGNSKLNISYNIPKSGAEEGLVDNYHEDAPLVLKKVVKIRNENMPVSKKTETIKAKTVAQKRKLLEKQRLKELKKQKATNIPNIIKQHPKNDSIVNNTETSKQKSCYIEVNNKKLWVNGTKPNMCIAKISSSEHVGPPVKQYCRKRKLSLLTELAKKYNETIKYRPGPLSKKSTLQVNGHDSWKTETKLLPKIILEVTPKIGYRLPSKIISRLPQCDGLVTAEFAEFAISMLKTKNDTSTENKTFKYPIKYKNNQEKIIVKKQMITTLKYHTEGKYNEDRSIKSVVASVIDDLIRYVEIKEIAPLLIKEEENEDSFQDRKLDNMPVIADNISNIIKKPQKKKSKVELELLRLNCKVVNVEVEENSIEESCSKPYCRLGCVCKSLKCDGMITYHCQNVTCMLECKCPRERSIEFDKLMLPAGTDILSSDTVTRIEDEAKKDMARVEREFTQMVIHTNDKTIVVGTGGRHKTRRSTKAPVKYSDYIDSNFQSIEEDRKRKTPVKNNTSKECFVSLEKLNLQGIVPYCMLHNLYSCHCDGKPVPANYISKNPVINTIHDKPTDEQIYEKKPAVDKKCLKSIKMSSSKPRIQKEFLSNSNIFNNCHPGGKLMSTSGRPIRLNKKLQEDFTYFHELDFQVIGCARTIGIPYNRRVKRHNSAALLNTLTKNDFINGITQFDVNKAKCFRSTSNTLEVDVLKQQLILESENRKKSMSLLIEKVLSDSKHKRKQTLEVRTDDVIPKPLLNKNLAIQRRKKSGFVTKRNAVIEAVFDGEIIVDERNMELLQKMGTKTVLEGYARLLPWTALINSFNKEEIKIWCMVDQPSRLLINKADKNPPKNYIDIRKTTQTTEVIVWILRNKLPQRYHEDHISFILKQTKDNFEICGLCTKNLNDTSLINPVNHEKEEANDTDTIFFKHKDLNGVQQLMCLSKGKFKLQELVEETLAAFGETSIEKNKLYMWAALPEVYPMCKWRMIFLNSDFTFLYFTKVKYSIKYTDLLNASNRAREANCTVILRNSIICNPNYHSAFGIYFDAHYQDRLFIGPFFKQHKYDDIETLRYINQSLVCTESFNKMQGKTDYKSGHWLVERPYSNLSKRPIDLTEDIQIVKGSKRKQNFESPPLFVKKSKCKFSGNNRIIVTQNNDHIKVLDSEPKRPDEFNRYIITNIPHLGYLGAFQHEDTIEIDVSWPFENKMLRFPCVSSAIDFLQSRFSSLLQPVPENFRINILVLTDIDLEKTKPIDVRILSGHYICGEFGCYNIKTITNEFCVNKIGTPREELLRIFARKAQIFVRQKIEELANVVNIPVSEKGRHDIVNILDKARMDIESLTELEKQIVVEKDDLLLRKRELALKVFCLISALPEKEKSVENWKFRQILKKQSILLPKTVMEPIEILDSDDEENNTSSQDDSSTNQHVMCDIRMSSEAAASDSDITDHKFDLAEITPLPRLSPTKIPCSKQSGSLKPCSSDITVTNQVNNTAAIQYAPQRKLKSILKSNTIISRVESSSSAKQSVNKVSEMPKQYLSGVKLVKTSEGKLMLVSDHQSATGKPHKLKSLNANQLIIRNNEIMSAKSVGSHKIEGLQNFAKPDNKFIKIPISPPKTIILKKSALLKNNKISIVNDKTTTSLNSNINSDSVLNNSQLVVPGLISFEGDSKDTDINRSNDNDKTEQNNLINVINTDKQTNLVNESKSCVETFRDVEAKNVTMTSEKPSVENFTDFSFDNERDKITTDLSLREGYTDKKNCADSPITDEMVKITEDMSLEEDHTDKKNCANSPLTDEMVKITEDMSLEEDHTDKKNCANSPLTDEMVKITEDMSLEEDHTDEKSCVESCTNSPLNNEIDEVDKNLSLQGHTKESHLKDCTNSLRNEMDTISKSNALEENQTDEKSYVEDYTNFTFTNEISRIAKDLSQKEYHTDEESKETEDVSLEENHTDEECSVENCTQSSFTNDVDKITKDLFLKEDHENEESPLENVTSNSQFGEIDEMDRIPKLMSLEEDQMDEESCMETCTNSQPNYVVDNITENISLEDAYTEEESSSEKVIGSPCKDEITEDIVLTKNEDNEVTGLVHPIINPDQKTKSDSSEKINTTLESNNSCFGNPVKSINQPLNSDISFLVNNVSEIFPSKHGHVRCEKINITNTASLTQVTNAANDSTNNLLPLENLGSVQNGSNADSKTNEQFCILSNMSETIMHATEKCKATNSCAVSEEEITNRSDNFIVGNEEIAEISEISIDKKNIQRDQEQILDSSKIKSNTNLFSVTEETEEKQDTSHNVDNTSKDVFFSNKKLLPPIESITNSMPIEQTPMSNETDNIDEDDNDSSHNEMSTDSKNNSYKILNHDPTEQTSEEDKISEKEERHSLQSRVDCSKTQVIVNVESDTIIDTDRTCGKILEQHDARFSSSIDVDQNCLKVNPTEVTLADKNVSSFESNSNIGKDIQPSKPSISKKLLCMDSGPSHNRNKKKRIAGQSNEFKQKFSKQISSSSAKMAGKHSQFSSKSNIHKGKKLDTGMKSKRKKLNISKKFIHKSQLNNAPKSFPINSLRSKHGKKSKNINTDFTLDKLSFSISQFDIQKKSSVMETGKISNMFIPNLEITKENTKPNKNKEAGAENLIPKINHQIYSVQNDIIEKPPLLFKNDTIEKIDKNFTTMSNNEDTSSSTNCNIIRESSSTCKEYNSNINSETTSEVTNVIPKKPTLKRSIKCANAKINTAFSIVKDTKEEFGTAVPLLQKLRISLQEEPSTVIQSIQDPKISHQEDQIETSTFPHKIGKKLTQDPEKKSIGNGRRRKEMICTSDLIVASKIVSIANEGSKDIADKICALAENTLSVTPLKIINKENFLKNAQLAEKMINIGDMKKKLQNNIYEDNDCQLSVDIETNLEITREQDSNTYDETETKH